MRMADFMVLTPAEAEAVCRAHREAEEQRSRDAWERMRMLASISIQPHVKKKIRPRDLLPFPWENGRKAQQGRPETETLTKEEAKERLQGLMARAKGKSSGREV